MGAHRKSRLKIFILAVFLMNEKQKLNTVNHFAGAKNEHPPSFNAFAKNASAVKMPTDYEAQAALTQQLVTAAQNGDKAALEQLCIFMSRCSAVK